MNRLCLLLSFFFSVCWANALLAFDINVFEKEADRQFIDDTISAFMQKYALPGLSIAIAKGDKFILAKGYGFANTDTRLAVTPAHQFRIASLSKPITSVAIMKLVDEGKLSLDDKVFGAGGLLSIPYPASNKHVSDITVRHLLTHSAAPEWTNDGNGPMFLKAHLSKKALVEWVLENRKLKHAPGTQYAYSNFGYCILGLVIEKLTAMPYDKYVKQSLLLPAKARSFALASDKRGGSPLEVSYYAHDGWSPYNLPVRRMDAHGGWIANAMDVVKFIQHTDAYPSPADLISAESIKIMTRPSPLNNNYAMGWNVNQNNNWWHTGMLPGTAAIMVRTSHGFNWAVLTNKTSKDKDFYGELDGLTWKLLKGVKDSL